MRTFPTAVIILYILILLPGLVEACPICIGRDDQSYLSGIIIPIALFLISPFIVFCAVAVMIKKYSGRQEVHNREA